MQGKRGGDHGEHRRLREQLRQLRVGAPERFNSGRDVIDVWEEDRPAMTWLGTSGEERRLTFGDFSRLCSKFANVAREMGVGRGDRVMVLLGKVPEGHATLTGLLKLGEG